MRSFVILLLGAYTGVLQEGLQGPAKTEKIRATSLNLSELMVFITENE